MVTTEAPPSTLPTQPGQDPPPAARTSAYLVVNPRSGSYEAKAFADALAGAADGTVVRTEVYELTGDEVLRDVIRGALARGFEAVVAVGGDGTVSAVASALIGTGVPLGIVPSGTGNALARELGIPLSMPEALALILGEHRLRAIDVIAMGDRHYVMNVSAGFTPVVMRETHSTGKKRFGMLAYLWQGIKHLSGIQRHRYRLRLDGRDLPVRASEVMVANAGRIGTTQMRWGEDIRPDDGELSVCVVRARTLADYVRLGLNLLLRRSDQDPSLRCLSARDSVEIGAERPIPVQGDGEPAGHTPVSLRLLPAAVEVIVPLLEDTGHVTAAAGEGGLHAQ